MQRERERERELCVCVLNRTEQTDGERGVYACWESKTLRNSTGDSGTKEGLGAFLKGNN